jgi:Mg2+/Co2+ transporter CorB
VNIPSLVIVLILLLAISAFFAAAETGMMSLNRYKLRHLARDKHRNAQRVLKLLERPDRLLSVILIGSTFANNLASMVAIVLAQHYFGDVGMAITVVSLLLTFVILIFSEVGPKTLAALHPQSIAFGSAWLLSWLLRILTPIVWLANVIVRQLLRLFGIHSTKMKVEHLTREELRTVLREATGKIPEEHQTMLLSLLDLEKMTVEDIMIPKQEITGIDLNAEPEDILELLETCQHQRLPVFRDHVDDVLGMIKVRDALTLLTQEPMSTHRLLSHLEQIYFIPEGTTLMTQLLNFRKEKHRNGLVVDEYGEIIGLVTLGDILEEIVGEFSSHSDALQRDIHPQEDGSFIVDASITVRELNRLLQWELPTRGPKTLSGLIIEYLQDIPRAQTGVKLSGYPIEIIQVKDNMVKTARIIPKTKVRKPK